MEFRPLSVVSDFREALFQSMDAASNAGLEIDQIQDLVREELEQFEQTYRDRYEVEE